MRFYNLPLLSDKNAYLISYAEMFLDWGQKVKNRRSDFDWKKNSNTNLLNTFFEILSRLFGIQDLRYAKTQNFTI
jgi:hypothetical protein